METSWRQLADKLTYFFLICNQRRPLLHRVNYAWFHFKRMRLARLPCRAHEDDRPLRHGAEHLKSKKVHVYWTWRTQTTAEWSKTYVRLLLQLAVCGLFLHQGRLHFPDLLLQVALLLHEQVQPSLRDRKPSEPTNVLKKIITSNQWHSYITLLYCICIVFLWYSLLFSSLFTVFYGFSLSTLPCFIFIIIMLTDYRYLVSSLKLD